MKNKFLIAIPFLISSLSLNAQEKIAPSLNEMIDSAIVHSQDVAIQQYNIDAANISKKKAAESYLPTLGVNAKYAYFNSSSETVTPAIDLSVLGIAQTIPSLDLPLDVSANLFTADAELGILLISGGKVPLMHKAAAQNVLAQEAVLAQNKEKVKAEIIKSYDQIALLHQVKKVLDEAQKRYDVNAKTAEKAHEYGLITSYELQKINVAAAQLEAKKTAYEGQLQLLYKHLSMLTHIDEDRLMKIEHQLSPVLSEEATSFANRTEVKALNAAIEAKTYMWKAENTWWIPKVKAVGGVGFMQANNINISSDKPLPMNLGTPNLDIEHLRIWPNYKVGIGMHWDIFDGLKGHRATQLAKIEVEKSKLQLDKASELMQLNLVKTNNEMNRLQKELVAKEKQVKVSEDALRIAEKEFKVGLIKSSDLVNAEADYQNAALDKIQTLFLQRRAAVDQMIATGIIDIEKF